ARAVVLQMQAERIGPSASGGADSGVELRVVVGQQRSQRGALPDWVALEISVFTEFCELAVRRAYFGTFEIIHVEIGQQMQPRLECDNDNLERAAAVVGDERFGPRHHQQVERIVVGATLASGELCRLR